MDFDGNSCAVSERRATCFCLHGGVFKVVGVKDPRLSKAVMNDLHEQINIDYPGSQSSVTSWNDVSARTIVEVRKLVKNTRARLRRELEGA